ncbi:alpha-amylase [Stakelama sp. CBK3Z-3]|uniref:Alpha-amylase n=1 Tax=Stakelama flava TaxID=2860338 RepID=A0ABS6XLU7_9SPHN|nr:alpha-amylase family glycosyl hydrolase [Stakelama flava]MBW4331131.1 alpha-amylase [Stakelama flava]
MKTAFLSLFALGCALAAPAQAQSGDGEATGFRDRLPQDEVIYFVLPDRFDNGDTANDRGGLRGERDVTGYDPTDTGYYHGGDLKGLIGRLGYLQDMGITAIWVAPVFKNKAVQGGEGHRSAGYHGYWITDFTRIDPHFGSNADFKTLVDAAHARGMKVYMDIVVNHTADVIQYRECRTGPCDYRSIADYPYGTKGGVDGTPINPGFAGDGVATRENFAKLTDPDFAYTPFVAASEKSVKVPAWLNDPIYYHNRGDSKFADESSTMGDFSGLDDVMTENPRVVDGMIDIFGGWIDTYGVDGFRIDTARHVDKGFWKRFVPAMQERARAKGIPNFTMFGEVALLSSDPGGIAIYTRYGLPAVLDFAFRQAIVDTVASDGATDVWEKLFDGDALYDHGFDTAVTLPTFTGNHDFGRLPMFIEKNFPDADSAEVMARVKLANAMLLTLRGVPTIYSGDEQGFVGDGGDQGAREDMFASKVASYNDNDLLGTDATTATDNFDRTHPLYREIAMLAHLRTATPALRRGRQVLRERGDKPGLLAISRFDPESGKEVLLLFNTARQPVDRLVHVETASQRWQGLAGDCAPTSAAPGSVRAKLPAFGYAVCAAK